MNVLPPIRAERTRTLNHPAPPEAVFPLLCPVREVEWVDGWDPQVVYSRSGVVELDCVFTTRDQDAEAVWMVTRHDPERFALEMVKVTPGSTAVKLIIALEAAGDGGTAARVTYLMTALSDRGRERVEAFTEESYDAFMKRWEEELNHYLESGGGLDGGEPRYE